MRTDGRYQALSGYVALLAPAVVVFTVFRFCDTHQTLQAGSPVRTLLDSLDGAVPSALVILAFVTFRPLAAAVVDGRAPPSVARTAARYGVVLLPAYWLVVLVVWSSRQSRLPGDWRDLLEHLTFTQVFDGQRIFYTVGPAWAVSVAVQLCLLTAGLATLTDRCCRRLDEPPRLRLRALAAGTAALALVSLGWRAWSHGVRDRVPEGSFTTWYGPLANLDVFAVGMALALVVVALARVATLSTPARLALRAAGLAVLVTGAVAREHHPWAAVYAATTSAVGFGLLVAAEVVGPGPDPGDAWTRALRSRALRWPGSLSLGVYLWHEPVMLALRPSGLVSQAPGAFGQDLVVVSVATIAVSWLTYVAVQVPVARLVAVADRTRQPVSAAPTS